MRFDYGGEAYAEGFERVFGPKVCKGDHNLELVAPSPEDRICDGDITCDTLVCGKLVCKKCDVVCTVTTNRGAPLCEVCGLPQHMHSVDKKSFVIDGLGAIPCWPREEKR